MRSPFLGINKGLLRKSFIEVLEPFGWKGFERDVKGNKSILRILAKEQPQILNFLEGLIRRGVISIEMLAPKDIIKWLKEDRPDLYRYYKTHKKECDHWIKKQARELNGYFHNI